MDDAIDGNADVAGSSMTAGATSGIVSDLMESASTCVLYRGSLYLAGHRVMKTTRTMVRTNEDAAQRGEEDYGIGEPGSFKLSESELLKLVEDHGFEVSGTRNNRRSRRGTFKILVICCNIHTDLLVGSPGRRISARHRRIPSFKSRYSTVPSLDRSQSVLH